MEQFLKPPPPNKMYRPLFYAPLAITLVLFQQVPTTSAILPTIIGLAAAKTAAIGTVALLGLKAKFLGAKLGGYLGASAAAASRRGSGARYRDYNDRGYNDYYRGSSNYYRGSNYRRGKRSVEDLEEENFTIESLVDLEVEDCYKRVICAASTGELDNPRVQNVLAIFNTDLVQDNNISNKAMKFVEAARYGGSLRNVAKCEQRYTCTVGMDLLQELF